MLFFDLNIDISYLNLLIFFSVITLFCGVIIFIVVSYFTIKFLQLSIDDNNVFFYKYNKKSQRILDSYGDCKINKIYLVKQPLGKMITTFLNVITLYNYKKCISDLNDTYLYHAAFIFELIAHDGNRKFILLEKNNFINISDNFKMYDNQEIKYIKINNKNLFTLNKILSKTQHRIGIHNFFNWNTYKNNCIEFSKEILITLNKLNNKNIQFISCDKIINNLNLSDFTIHIINSIIVIYNILEKYINGNFY